MGFRELSDEDIVKAATLLIRSLYESGGLGRVEAVTEIVVGTPEGGWSATFIGETNKKRETLKMIAEGDSVRYGTPQQVNQGDG